MSEYIVEKDTKHEDTRKKVDEMHKLFEGARQSLESIISMLDEILIQEEAGSCFGSLNLQESHCS